MTDVTAYRQLLLIFQQPGLEELQTCFEDDSRSNPDEYQPPTNDTRVHQFQPVQGLISWEVKERTWASITGGKGKSIDLADIQARMSRKSSRASIMNRVSEPWRSASGRSRVSS